MSSQAAANRPFPIASTWSNRPRDELIKAWPQFTAQEKARCAQEEKQAGPPSYVGWLTCLRINANARKDPKAAASIPTLRRHEAGRRRVNIRDVSRLTGQCGCRRRASRNHLLNKRLLVVLSGTRRTIVAKAPKTLDVLFHDTLKDIYFAEKKILSTLPKMAKAAHSDALKAAFQKHQRETAGQIDRLEQVFALIDKKPQAKTCDAIVGITDEGAEIMGEYKGSPALDAGLLAAAQAVEHYEIRDTVP